MKRRIKKLSVFGLLLLSLCLAALVWLFMFSPHSRTPADMVRSDAAIYVEATFTAKSLKKIQDTALTSQFQDLITSQLSQKTPVTTDDFLPWVGTDIAFAEFANNEFMIFASYRNKTQAEAFLQKFLLPGESLSTQETDLGTVFSPSFSSEYTFLFHGKYLVIADSTNTLSQNINTDMSLATSQTYVDFLRDLSPRRTLFMYVNTAAYAQKIAQDLAWERYSPLLTILAQNIPAVGSTVHVNNDMIDVRTKMLTVPGLFDQKRIRRQSPDFIPSFADFTAHNSLVFISGKDLYEQYLHTKTYLTQFHEDFPVLFDGILRAESQRLFGPKFDFEKDFLSKTQGPYALIIDQEDNAYPFLRYSFLTEFTNADTKLNLKQVEEALLFAQSKFVTQVQTVELPDGTTRDELVSIPASSLQITEKEHKGTPYFTIVLPTADQQFSYGFIRNNFIFSTHEAGFQSIIDVVQNDNINLTYNSNFRDTIVNDFARSQTYGYVNLDKMNTINTLIQKDTPHFFSFSDFIGNNFKSFVFSKRTYPNQTLWRGMLFFQ